MEEEEEVNTWVAVFLRECVFDNKLTAKYWRVVLCTGTRFYQNTGVTDIRIERSHLVQNIESQTACFSVV